MMRQIRYFFLGLLLLVVIVLCVANAEFVTLNMLPAPLAPILPVSIDLPLFAVILASILMGLLIGQVLEYIREYKHRKTASQKKREAELLARQVDELKRKNGLTDDDIMALLD
jgi:lipopolysaccharide assembly protein A